MRTIFYSILGVILTTLLFQACTKDDDVIVQGNTEQEVLKDSIVVENRNGTTSAIYYISSNSISYHQKQYQIAFNRDSVVSTQFVRTVGSLSETYTKSLGTLDPSYTNKPARKYNITVTLLDTTYYFPGTWIKDTIATTFNKVGNINLFPGANKVYRTDRTNVSKKYYDTNYKKLKYKYEYVVKTDTVRYLDFIPSNNSGSIFWVNHKM